MRGESYTADHLRERHAASVERCWLGHQDHAFIAAWSRHAGRAVGSTRRARNPSARYCSSACAIGARASGSTLAEATSSPATLAPPSSCDDRTHAPRHIGILCRGAGGQPRVFLPRGIDGEHERRPSPPRARCRFIVRTCESCGSGREGIPGNRHYHGYATRSEAAASRRRPPPTRGVIAPTAGSCPGRGRFQLLPRALPVRLCSRACRRSRGRASGRVLRR
jgi:hypothetical protein